MLVLFSSFRSGNHGTWKLTNFIRVTDLRNGRAGIWISGSLAKSLPLYSLPSDSDQP